jgi:hypothetical protein
MVSHCHLVGQSNLISSHVGLHVDGAIGSHGQRLTKGLLGLDALGVSANKAKKIGANSWMQTCLGPIETTTISLTTPFSFNRT